MQSQIQMSVVRKKRERKQHFEGRILSYKGILLNIKVNQLGAPCAILKISIALLYLYQPTAMDVEATKLPHRFACVIIRS